MKKRLVAAALLSFAVSGTALAAPPRHHDHDHDQHHPSHQPSHHSYGHHRGERLDRNHWGERVDYRHYGLRAPPRGQEWHRVDNDYVLVAVATGLIASVIAAH